jgi:predicted CoA-binding protein
MAIVTRKTIEDFYAGKRLAVVGVSRSQSDYSRGLFRELVKRGYEVIPVNPHVKSVEGKKCFSSVKAIKPAVDRVIILLPPDKSEQAVEECMAAGVKNIWLHQHIARGVANTRVIYLCEKSGISLIAGFCPFMFMPGTALLHRFHGSVLRLMGAYPK